MLNVIMYCIIFKIYLISWKFMNIPLQPSYSYTRKQTVKAGTVRTEILTEEKWRVTY